MSNAMFHEVPNKISLRFFHKRDMTARYLMQTDEFSLRTENIFIWTGMLFIYVPFKFSHSSL